MSRCASPLYAASIAEEIRGYGEGPVVWTNGAFDLLHAGHVQTLEEAREQGGYLIVGMNSDSSVRARKGPSRPIIPEGQRAAMLCALRCVDLVVVFDELKPESIVRLIRPDVIVVGYGQAPQIGERFWPLELAAKLEARVHVVEATGWYGVSTTAIIRQILWAGEGKAKV